MSPGSDMTSVLRRRLYKGTDTQGECHVTMKAETGVTQLQARNAEDCQQTTGNWDKARKYFPSVALPTLSF